MGKKNPIEKSKYINERYKEYLRSSFEFRSKRLQSLFEQQLDKEELFKGPYVALNLPFQRGKNINQLIEEGVVSPLFKCLRNVDFERPLYLHQEKAIRQIGAGKSAIVTTGTGSGKTECFLYPILNEIMRQLERGDQDAGIRAIFLYPMNALVNDQIDRVRKILSNFPDITFGFFTGDTQESTPNNFRKIQSEIENIAIPNNELVSREEIRDNPPHLLFTNYSMLEYLLIRPKDCPILMPERLKNWKFVVLDEAHIYNGSLGIEISMLMRRLVGMANNKPRFILTSATLGEQGKSEKDIVDFAQNLTSELFEVEEIIFSKRIPFNGGDTQYYVSGEDYTQLKEAKGNVSIIKKIVSSYREVTGTSVSELLYDLLSNDRNVYEIYSMLRDTSVDFHFILKHLKGTVTERQLIDLIDLINYAEKDKIGIFDLKYHSFVRPINGVYITLEKEPRLSLTKTNMIGEYKAFEIGNCRYCNAPYIIGKIHHNNKDGLDYLFQNKEVDIYENYGDNQSVSVDYFLFDDDINEEVDQSIIEEYKVCVKCGEIHTTKNLNADSCDCGNEYHRSIYRVLRRNNNEKFEWNNIGQCPSCGHKGIKGIVKSANLGKDEGTALIAQTLLESMEEGEERIKENTKLSLKRSTEHNSSSEPQSKVKQFIAFSDSRQQASFAATFIDSNHVRMLRKRILWKVIEDNNYKDISVGEMATKLTRIIKEKNLFSNKLSSHKNAWISILVDLLKVDGIYDGEGMGLYYFDLDISGIMSRISEEDVKEEFGQYGITKRDLATMMQVVLGMFKTTPAINYDCAQLTPDEKREELE